MQQYTSEEGRLRLKAEETRVLAEMMKDPEARKILLDLAEQYENLAEQARLVGPKP
jgi:hypothetical protein